MLALGTSIVGEMNTDKDLIKTVFMDIDFKDRTVLHLICHNTYVDLLSDQRVTALLDNLWQGELTSKCDGRLEQYSKLSHMASSTIMKLPGQNISFGKFLYCDFKYDITSESHSIQFLYRKSSIAIIYMKSFISSVIVVGIFTQINIKYCTLFN